MSRTLCSALIGRSRETARLEGAIQASLASHGGVVLVAGTAGIGKSRLVAHALEAARASGATALLGRAVPAEVPEPYRPLTEALVSASLS